MALDSLAEELAAFRTAADADLGALGLLRATSVGAQETDDNPTQLWLSYHHQHKVSERVRAFRGARLPGAHVE